MKERFQNLLKILSFRTMWADQEEDEWEDYDHKEDYISGDEYADTTKQRAGLSSGIVYLAIIVMAIIAVIAYHVMSHYHLYTGYSITESYPAEDISGTRYEKLGNGFIKYGSDGVTYVDGRNETQWSTAYTMETPTTDICGEVMLIYEQQGYIVELLNTEGVLGSFQTDLPILKGVVAKNGVSAMMLKDGQDVRVRLVSIDGTTLAEVHTTLEDQGQPVDLALSSNGQNLIVSQMKIGAGTVNSVVAFYDFSASADADETHLVGSFEYTDEVFPSVCYLTDKIAAAIGDKGFVTFTGGKEPGEKAKVTVTTEILSVFHDSSNIGFITPSELVTDRYRMLVYNLNGKKKSEMTFSHGYSQIKMDSGEILLNDSGHLMVFTPGGVYRLDTDYEKQIGAFVKIPGFRKYTIMTNDGMDRIKIE